MYLARVTRKKEYEVEGGVEFTIWVERIKLPRGLKMCGVPVLMMEDDDGNLPWATRRWLQVGQVVILAENKDLIRDYVPPAGDDFSVFMAGLMVDVPAAMLECKCDDTGSGPLLLGDEDMPGLHTSEREAPPPV